MGKKGKVGKDRRDKFYKLAKETGYRSRAAFKLIQLNRRFGFLQQSQVCIDLCAAPGGWMQVAKQNMPVSSIVIGVDLFPIRGVPGCISIVGDITSDKTKSDLAKELKTWKADVVLNDGAPNVGRNWLFDAYQQVCLTLSAVRLATQFLRPGGWFVTKVFRSKDYNALIWVLKQLFKKVHATKPSASRKESAEIFVVCQFYRAPDKIDPKFLDPKYVFEELEIEANEESANILKELERKTAKKPKVQGYDSLDVRKIISATAFLQETKPLGLLSRITEIQFGEGDAIIANHPRTTAEIRECCKDIKVLGRKDLKDLLRWHKLMSAELSLKPENQNETNGEKEGTANGSAEEDEDADMVELKQLDKEIEALKANEARDTRRKRKKANKERTKLNEKLSLKMVIKGDEGPTEDSDGTIFALKTLHSKQQLKAALDQVPDVLQEPDGDGDDDDNYRNRKRPMYVSYDKETKGDLYEDENILAGSDGESDDDSEADAEAKGLGLDSDENDESETMAKQKRQKGKGGDDSDNEEQHPLLTDLDHRSKTDKRQQRVQLWYEREAFQKQSTNPEEVGMDYDLDRMVEAYKKSGVKVIGGEKETASEKPPLGKKARRRARHAATKDDDSSSSSSSDEEESASNGVTENGVHRTVQKVTGKNGGFDIVSSGQSKPKKIKLNEEELALGQLIINSKKTKRDIIDAAWNRYMFNDSHLPDWFVKDEEKTMKREVPVPAEAVDRYRKASEDFNVRTIKKVMEAKARKKRHATKRLAKIKKKAETIMENVDNTNQEKIRLLKKLYKKADGKKKEITYVVAKRKGVSGKKVRRPKGVEGRFKVVDPRLKKDKRAEQAKGRKKFGKGGKGGKGGRNAKGGKGGKKVGKGRMKAAA